MPLLEPAGARAQPGPSFLRPSLRKGRGASPSRACVWQSRAPARDEMRMRHWQETNASPRATENPAACEPSVLCSEYSEAGEGSRALLHATRTPNCEDALLGLGTWAYQKLFKNRMNFKIFLKVKKKVQRLAK